MVVAVPEATCNFFLQAPIWCEAIGTVTSYCSSPSLGHDWPSNIFRLFRGPTNQLRDRVQAANNRILVNSAEQFFVPLQNKMLIF